MQLWSIHRIHKQCSESGGLGQLEMVIPNKWSYKTLSSFTARYACTRQKRHPTDPINTTGLYLLVCVQDSLIHNNLPLQKCATGTRPGLHSRESLGQWTFPAKETEKAANTLSRDIKQMTEPIYLWVFFSIPLPYGIITHYRKLRLDTAPPFPKAHEDSQTFGLVTACLLKA